MRLSTFALALRLPGALAAPATKRDSPAPLIIPRGAALIPNQYIVKLKDNSGAAAVSDALASAHDEATHRYNNVFKGFAGRMDAATVARLRNDPNVCCRNSSRAFIMAHWATRLTSSSKTPYQV